MLEFEKLVLLGLAVGVEFWADQNFKSLPFDSLSPLLHQCLNFEAVCQLFYCIALQDTEVETQISSPFEMLS